MFVKIRGTAAGIPRRMGKDGEHLQRLNFYNCTDEESGSLEAGEGISPG